MQKKGFKMCSSAYMRQSEHGGINALVLFAHVEHFIGYIFVRLRFSTSDIEGVAVTELFHLQYYTAYRVFLIP